MSSAIKAIEEDRKVLLELCQQMDDSVWTKDSGCPGWSVQDLLSHMACSFWLAVDPRDGLREFANAPLRG